MCLGLDKLSEEVIELDGKIQTKWCILHREDSEKGAQVPARVQFGLQGEWSCHLPGW